MVSVFKQIVALRKRRQMDQRTLEPLTGLKQPHIARIENGQDVRLSTLEKLVKALGAALVVVPRDRLAEVEALLSNPPGYSAEPDDYRPYAHLEVRDDD